MHDEKNIVVISQARMTSTRLPGKVLKELKGRPLLDFHLSRLHAGNLQTIIATTTNATDQPISAWCEKTSIPCFKGSEPDVLDRYFGAARQFQADIIVRVTSDCPLIDASLIQQGLELYIHSNDPMTYVSNCFPRTFARGFDFEIFSMESLEEAHRNAQETFDREHVTPYMWQNKSGKIKLKNIAQATDNSHLRLCVDTVEDFDLMRRLIENYDCEDLPYDAIERFMNDHSELQKINAHIEQKKQ